GAAPAAGGASTAHVAARASELVAVYSPGDGAESWLDSDGFVGSFTSGSGFAGGGGFASGLYRSGSGGLLEPAPAAGAVLLGSLSEGGIPFPSGGGAGSGDSPADRGMRRDGPSQKNAHHGGRRRHGGPSKRLLGPRGDLAPASAPHGSILLYKGLRPLSDGRSYLLTIASMRDAGPAASDDEGGGGGDGGGDGGGGGGG
ncbi:unnamed protein product, partial [Phaeothamnion confervicola]